MPRRLVVTTAIVVAGLAGLTGCDSSTTGPAASVDRYRAVPPCNTVGKTMDGTLDPAFFLDPKTISRKDGDGWTAARACSARKLDSPVTVEVRTYLFSSTGSSTGSAQAAAFGHTAGTGGTADDAWRRHGSATSDGFPVDGWLWNPASCRLVVWRSNIAVTFTQSPPDPGCKPDLDTLSHALVANL